MLWNKEDFEIQASSISGWAIHAVMNVPSVKSWILSYVYASTNPGLINVVWDEMRKVASLHCPISVVGDFNVLAKVSDKKGGNVRTYGQLKKLNSVMNDCNLMLK